MNSLNVTEILGPRTNRTNNKREYSKPDRSYIYKVEGQRSNPLKLTNLPQNSRGDNTCHYFVIQVRTSEDFTITITIRDDKTNSFNFAFSTFARKTQQQQQDSPNSISRPSTSQTSALIYLDIPRNIWVTLYFDLKTLSRQYWVSGSYHSLDKIEISPTCSVRWVFTQEELIINETNDIELPKGLEYPNGISNTIIVIPSNSNSNLISNLNPNEQGQFSPGNTRALNSKASPRISNNPSRPLKSPNINLPPSIPIASIGQPDFNQPSSSVSSAKQKSSRDKRIPSRKKTGEVDQKDSSRSEKQIAVSAIPVSLKRAEKIEEKYDKEREKQKASKLSTKTSKPAFRSNNKTGINSKSGKNTKNKADADDEANFAEFAGSSIKMKKSSLLSNSKNVTAEISKTKNNKEHSKNSTAEFNNNNDNANNDDLAKTEMKADDFAGDQNNIPQLGEDDVDDLSGFKSHDYPYLINDDDDDDESDGSAFGGEAPQYETEFLNIDIPRETPDILNNNEDDEEEELELMYISALDCYYCPSNQQYYQIEDGNNLDV
ncbi:hypothetical protein M9Y10_013317 [Tritrichomonas musculus]|uniref:CFA20 domain-containing protein n=1 Tax=Tritrichomonas musculus TaxID=1915356 RepID=A0ABR2I723_9EUKA